jgi:hypothetical protein
MAAIALSKYYLNSWQPTDFEITQTHSKHTTQARNMKQVNTPRSASSEGRTENLPLMYSNAATKPIAGLIRKLAIALATTMLAGSASALDLNWAGPGGTTANPTSGIWDTNTPNWNAGISLPT